MRCARPECNAEIEGSYVRFNGRHYCSYECCQLYLVQAQIFTVAADPFSRKRYSKSANESMEGFGGGRDYGDENDSKQGVLPLHEP